MTFEQLKDKHQKFIYKMTVNPQGKKAVNALSKLHWAQTSYGMEGGELTTEDVRGILMDRSVRSGTIEDHIMIKNYGVMLTFLYNSLGVKDKADLPLLKKTDEILCRDEKEAVPEEILRKKVTIIPGVNVIPVTPQDIPASLERMFQQYYARRGHMDPVMRASYIHNEIFRIYPFEKNSEGAARAMLNFELLAADFPPIPFVMEVTEYQEAIRSWIKEEDFFPFYEMIVGALDERLTRLLEML